MLRYVSSLSISGRSDGTVIKKNQTKLFGFSGFLYCDNILSFSLFDYAHLCRPWLRYGTTVVIKAIGSLSNENDNGSENMAKKMNTRSFKLKRVYLD